MSRTWGLWLIHLPTFYEALAGPGVPVGEILSSAQLAARLGLPERTARRALANGRWQGLRVGKVWLGAVPAIWPQFGWALDTTAGPYGHAPGAAGERPGQGASPPAAGQVPDLAAAETPLPPGVRRPRATRAWRLRGRPRRPAAPAGPGRSLAGPLSPRGPGAPVTRIARVVAAVLAMPLLVAVLFVAGPGSAASAPAAQVAAAATGLPDVTAPTQAVAAAIAYAEKQIGCPYLYGGTGPCQAGFDCSGLVMMAYRAAGISIARTSQQQWATEVQVPASQVQPGDLVSSSARTALPPPPGTWAW